MENGETCGVRYGVSRKLVFFMGYGDHYTNHFCKESVYECDIDERRKIKDKRQQTIDNR